jgi:hypothetical protein
MEGTIGTPPIKTHTFRKRVRKVKLREVKKSDKSDVKLSEVRWFYITSGESSDYVATSYRLDGPGSFPGSIFILFSSVFFVFCCVL